MSTLKPNIKQMLDIASDCGLNTLEEALNNYMNHYDMFFLISDYVNQKRIFDQELINKGFTVTEEGKIFLKQMTITEALLQLEEIHEP